MSRSAKTKHVLDLVGSGSTKRTVSPSLQEALSKEPSKEKPQVPTFAEEMSEITGRPVEDFRLKENSPPPKDEPPPPKQGITSIVAELINQELNEVVSRFNLIPTDSNLWELTRSAIETVRPEFSRNAEEYVEKCERLRPKVIKEMTKAAIRVAAWDKKNKDDD